MKKITILCNFGEEQRPFDVYIGKPKKGNHPLQNQSQWLASEFGGTIPAEDMNAIRDLSNLAVEHKVSLEELCTYYYDEQKTLAEIRASLESQNT